MRSRVLQTGVELQLKGASFPWNREKEKGAGTLLMPCQGHVTNKIRSIYIFLYLRHIPKLLRYIIGIGSWPFVGVKFEFLKQKSSQVGSSLNKIIFESHPKRGMASQEDLMARKLGLSPLELMVGIASIRNQQLCWSTFFLWNPWNCFNLEMG